MRIVVQRVKNGQVCVAEDCKGSISKGFAAFLGFHEKDDLKTLTFMADKLVGLRIFPDLEGKMNLSVQQCSGGILLIPNFTLYGDCNKGFRPSFIQAAKPEQAKGLFDTFVTLVKDRHGTVASGVFQAEMTIALVNDGPVTLILER